MPWQAMRYPRKTLKSVLTCWVKSTRSRHVPHGTPKIPLQNSNKNVYPVYPFPCSCPWKSRFTTFNFHSFSLFTYRKRWLYEMRNTKKCIYVCMRRDSRLRLEKDRKRWVLFTPDKNVNPFLSPAMKISKFYRS